MTPPGPRAATPLLIAALAAPALAPANEPKPPLRFDVTLADDVVDRPLDGRLFVLLSRREGVEPRKVEPRTGLDAPPLFARDVVGLVPGRPAAIDGHAAAFPSAGLAQLEPGDYWAQAVLDTNDDLKSLDAPGNLFGPVRRVHLDPAAGGAIPLELNQRVPPEQLPKHTEYVRYIKLRSDLLSDFHKRPIFLRAAVILPRDWDREPDRRYPLRVHIGGYGSRFTEIPPVDREGSASRRLWLADDAPRMLFLKLDGDGPFGDCYQVNSDVNGPYGDAVTRELIPHVERTFRGLGRGDARFLDGGSTGGWVSLALQVFYPDFFNGAWAACPDAVDFRSFQLINIYRDDNAYLNEHSFERPGARDADGDVRYTMRHECQLENVLGRGDSWANSGQQWGAWNAAYGPRGDDGGPLPLWEPTTGAINKSLVEHWKRYDLRLVLEANWPTLGPKLRGKLNIWVGEADDYFLNNAVHRLDQSLSRADPPADARIEYAPGRGHCWMGLDEAAMMREMAARVGRRGD